MTEREQKLQKALEWLINIHEDAFNKRGDYCQEFCPVRDHDQNCPAEYLEEYWDGEDEYTNWERDFGNATSKSAWNCKLITTRRTHND